MTADSSTPFVDPDTVRVPSGLGPLHFASRGDQVGPEYHARYWALTEEGVQVGLLDVSYLGKQAAIQWIEVPETYRRQGVASALAQRVRNESPVIELLTLGDVVSPEGAAFVGSGRRSHFGAPDPDVQPPLAALDAEPDPRPDRPRSVGGYTLDL